MSASATTGQKIRSLIGGAPAEVQEVVDTRRPARTPLPESASVVVIGGGVMGTSIAFHLAEAGVRDVVLLERDELGSGSTGKAAGGVRAQFSDEINIRLALRSLEAFKAFRRRPGWEIDLHQVGYLFLLDREEDVARFERDIELQNELGAPSRLLTPGQAKAASPLLDVGDVLAAAFCPIDGHATPEGVVQGYASAARRHGAHVRTRCAVVDIRVEGGTIREVVTSEGPIATGVVVCAAGPWAAAVGDMVGVQLPVTPLRRQVLFTEPMPDLPARIPMTIDFSSSFYFHREGPGLLVGMSDPDEEPGFLLETTTDWIPALLEVAQRRAPAIAETGIKGGWAGLYEMSPDHNALIGEAPGLSRFLYATGFSGHGFLLGPAVGEVVRDLVRGATPFVDVAGLAAERFAGRGSRPELTIV